MHTSVYFTEIDSPVGKLCLTASEVGVTGLYFSQGDKARQPEAAWLRNDQLLKEARTQLLAYFAGELTQFDLPLAPKVTPFQGRVLDALKGIPYGETRSYLQIAEAIGQPSASRAVGNANGRNPIGIVIPCHRVITSQGRLGGFGGGLVAKQYLLNLECGQKRQRH